MRGLGIIGVGAMGGALARRLTAWEKISPEAIILADKREEHVERLAQELGARRAGIPELAAMCDTVIIAVKPHQVLEVLSELKAELTPEHLLISVAAGVSLKALAQGTRESQPVASAMPYTPCLVG